jgi:hypothetical protein
MGACGAKPRLVNQSLEGSLPQVIAKGVEMNNIDAVLRAKTKSQDTLNPYRNPILNRRLRNSQAE